MLDPRLEIEDQTPPVSLVAALADYAASFAIGGAAAIETARHCLIDALGRGFDALRDPDCTASLGPVVPGAVMPGGARVPGTSLELEPAQAAFCTALMLRHCPGEGRWPDSRRGRAADSLGAILAITDYQARKATMEGASPPRVRDVLAAVAKALEIQGVLAAFDEDACPASVPPLLRLAGVASAAIATAQLGGGSGQIAMALSNACMDRNLLIPLDGRDVPGRSDWAAADTIGRAVRHACQAMTTGRRSFLTSADLSIVSLAGKLLGARPSIPKRPFGSAVIERLAGLRQPQDGTRVMAAFQAAVDRYFPIRQAQRIRALFAAPERLDDLPVSELIAALVTNGSR